MVNLTPDHIFYLSQRPSVSVSLSIQSDTLENIRRVAVSRDMSEAALLRLYIGQGLRQDLSGVFAECIPENSVSER